MLSAQTVTRLTRATPEPRGSDEDRVSKPKGFYNVTSVKEFPPHLPFSVKHRLEPTPLHHTTPEGAAALGACGMKGPTWRIRLRGRGRAALRSSGGRRREAKQMEGEKD